MTVGLMFWKRLGLEWLYDASVSAWGSSGVILRPRWWYVGIAVVASGHLWFTCVLEQGPEVHK